MGNVTDNHRDNQIESERLEWKREEERLKAELHERSKLLQEFSNKLRVLESKKEDDNGDKKRLQDQLSLLEEEKEKMGRKITELQGTVEELTLLQSDLRTAVSVAERFREEAQQKLDKAEKENQRLCSKEADEEDFKAPTTVNGSSLGYRSLPRGVTLNSTGESALKTRSQPSNEQETDSDMWHKEKRRGSMETLQYQPKPIENLASDSVSFLRRYGGSKRGVFLRWAQERTCGYKYVVITNFSSSWVDGMAFCALLHSYLPDSIPYSELRPLEKRKNLELAFEVAEDQDIPPLLTPDQMLQRQGPDWQKVLLYVEFIYQKFEA
ncbi:cytospin-A isoform X2 [Xenopus laevis]|nr:cytospin-A isoform X2 [Xenopus laevis]